MAVVSYPATMDRALRTFERLIITALVTMMALAILGGTLDVAWVFVKSLVTAPFDVLTVSELLDIFGTFLIVLIGLELLDTVKGYLTEHRVRGEAVLMVALIAVARKLIVTDPKDVSPATLAGVAALILALAGGYFLVRRR